MNKLTTQELKLISYLLEMASDIFSCHGSNDFNLSDFLTPEERKELILKMFTDNGTPEEFNADCDYRYIEDWWLMSYFSRLINRIANERSDQT